MQVSVSFRWQYFSHHKALNNRITTLSSKHPLFFLCSWRYRRLFVSRLHKTDEVRLALPYILDVLFTYEHARVCDASAEESSQMM